MPRSSFKSIYLPQLPSTPSVRYSRGAQRRASQLQQFLRLVEVGLAGQFGSWQSPELVLLSKADWRQVYSAAYGLPRLRGKAGAWQVYAAAEYPEKITQRFEPLMMAGAGATGRPGELREFFDLLMVQTHLVGALRSLDLTGLGVKGWLEPLLAAYALYGSLHASGLEALAQRFQAWALLEARGAEAVSPVKLRSGRLTFSQTRWAHGVSALCAIQCFEREQWALAEQLSSNRIHTSQPGDHRQEGLESLLLTFLETLPVEGAALTDEAGFD